MLLQAGSRSFCASEQISIRIPMMNSQQRQTAALDSFWASLSYDEKQVVALRPNSISSILLKTYFRPGFEQKKSLFESCRLVKYSIKYSSYGRVINDVGLSVRLSVRRSACPSSHWYYIKTITITSTTDSPKTLVGLSSFSFFFFFLFSSYSSSYYY